MPFWNEELQQWGYLYFEEVSPSEWLGINREVVLNMETEVEKLAINIIVDMEKIQEILSSVEVQSNFDGRCIAIAKTKLEEAQLWFANSRKG